MPLQPEDLSQKMLRHGMSPPEVFRYVEELRHHREDLIAELAQAGTPDDQAQQQADQRLGDTQTLATAAIAAHSRQTFMGRHPRLFFGFLPLFATPVAMIVPPVSVGISLILIAHATGAHGAHSIQMFERLTMVGCLFMNYLWPGMIGALVYRAVWRRGLGWKWRALSCSVVVAWGAWLYCWSRAGDGVHAGMFAMGMRPTPQFTQAVASIALITLCAWLLDRRGRRSTRTALHGPAIMPGPTV